MGFNKEEAYKIYSELQNVKEATMEYCESIGIPYENKYMQQLRRYAISLDGQKTFYKGNELKVSPASPKDIEVKDPYEVVVKEESFSMPSAWDEGKGRFLDIEEYCDKFGLPKDNVKSSKLVAHNAGHMIYNIEFRPTLSEASGITEEYIDEVITRYLGNDYKRKEGTGVDFKHLGNVFDRLVYTDVHVGMSPSGGRNVKPLYEDDWSKEAIESRLDTMISHVLNFKKSDIIYVDELGDFLDGFLGQTTRKGHGLPQNMSDKEAFEFAIFFKVALVDRLLKSYHKVVCNSVCEDNHAGVFGYFVNSSVKKILEAKYSADVVEYNVLERFMSHYSVGRHTFILTHGKDSESLKFGFKPTLDPKQIEKIDQYCKEYNLYNGNFVEFSKGDSHQFIFDYTTSNDFDYCNYPAFSPPSNWVSTNFKRSRSGFVFYNINMYDNIKNINPYIFKK